MVNGIEIEVVTGGFILIYDEFKDGQSTPSEHCEVFVSQSKLMKKVKDLLESNPTQE